MEQTIILMSLRSGNMVEELTEFPIFYSTNKKDIVEFADKVYTLAKKYGWINIKDFVDLWGKDTNMPGSVEWCVEYKDLPKKPNIKKDKTKGWYLEMPASYLF